MNNLFLSNKPQRQTKLLFFTCLLAFAVILLGAYTRLTDAGLSCPDWPHCYGYLTAPHTNTQITNATQLYPSTPVNTKKAWTEMTHRYFAGTEGILILFAAFSLWRRSSSPLHLNQRRTSTSSFIAVTLIALLTVQILLGMLTVTEKLKPVIVLSHLITGLAILSLLWWALLDQYWQHHLKSIHTHLKKNTVRWVTIGLLIVITQVTLGGWVSTHYAGLACVDFPYCNGTLLPTIQWSALNSDLISIHMLHRLGAFITAIYLGFLAFYLMRQRLLKINGIKILLLVAIQITLGILTLYWLRPVSIALLHHMTGILLLLVLIATLVKVTFIARKQHDSRIA